MGSWSWKDPILCSRTLQIITDTRCALETLRLMGGSLQSRITPPDKMLSMEKDLGLCLCACVEKPDCSNVNSLFLHVCSTCSSYILQIFTLRVKRSWSLSLVYSPVLSLDRLSRRPFFILTESDSSEGPKSPLAEKEQGSTEWGQGEREAARRKPLVQREREREWLVVWEKRAGEWGVSVQRDGWLVIL